MFRIDYAGPVPAEGVTGSRYSLLFAYLLVEGPGFIGPASVVGSHRASSSANARLFPGCELNIKKEEVAIRQSSALRVNLCDKRSVKISGGKQWRKR